MPTQSQLDKFSLTLGDPARARDTECTICQLPTTDAVITACLHIYCFECLHSWAKRHATCPICRTDLLPLSMPPPTGTLSAAAPDPTYPPSHPGGQRIPMEPRMRAYVNFCRDMARDHLRNCDLPVNPSAEVARTCGAVVIDSGRMNARLQVAADESLARIISRKPSAKSSRQAQEFFSWNVEAWSKLLETLDRYVFVERDVEAMLMMEPNAYADRARERETRIGVLLHATELVNLFKVLARKVVMA